MKVEIWYSILVFDKIKESLDINRCFPQLFEMGFWRLIRSKFSGLSYWSTTIESLLKCKDVSSVTNYHQGLRSPKKEISNAVVTSYTYSTNIPHTETCTYWKSFKLLDEPASQRLAVGPFQIGFLRQNFE